MSHVEIEKWTCEGMCRDFFQVRLYGKHKDNYVSAFLIQKKAWTSKGKLGSLAGSGFYALIGPHVKEIYDYCRVTELEFNVLSSHFRLLKYKLKKFADIIEAGTEVSKGREFTVVRMTVKEAT